MTVITDTDAPRRLRAMRNACLVMLGATAVGFAGELASYFSLTLCCLVWLSMALDKTAQLKVHELVAPDDTTPFTKMSGGGRGKIEVIERE